MTDPPPDEPEPPNDPVEVRPPAALPTEPSPVPLERHHPSRADETTRGYEIIELDHQALDFYTDMYPRSWAPAYLTSASARDLNATLPSTRLRPTGTDQPDPPPHPPRRHRSGAHRRRPRPAHRWRTRSTPSATDSCSPSTPGPTCRVRRAPQPHQARLPLRRTQVPQHPHHRRVPQGRATLRTHRRSPCPRRRRHPVLVEGPLDALAITLADPAPPESPHSAPPSPMHKQTNSLRCSDETPHASSLRPTPTPPDGPQPRKRSGDSLHSAQTPST